MEKVLKIKDIELLKEDELTIVSGGSPDRDTGFWYDAFYVITMSTLINPRPTSWATGSFGMR